MGTKEPIRFLKMKLATILAASAAASPDSERFFSTEYTGGTTANWWYDYPGIPAGQMEKMREYTPKFWNAYFGGWARFPRAQFLRNWGKLQDDMESVAEDCTFPDNRKRRSNGQEERFMNDFANDNFEALDAKSDFWAFVEGHARWIYFQVDEATCANKKARLLRRVDRLRYSVYWRYCRTKLSQSIGDRDDSFPRSLTKATKDQDPVGFCWWSLFDYKGDVKKHPRISMKDIQEGGKFSVN